MQVEAPAPRFADHPAPHPEERRAAQDGYRAEHGPDLQDVAEPECQSDDDEKFEQGMSRNEEHRRDESAAGGLRDGDGEQRPGRKRPRQRGKE